MKQPDTFEEGIQRLQELLGKLQDETTPLTQSVSLYAQAAELIQYCNEQLGEAKLKIAEIDAKLDGTVMNDPDLPSVETPTQQENNGEMQDNGGN